MKWLMGALTWRRSTINIVVSGLVGTLVALLVSYILIFSLDAAYFYAGMSYSSRTVDTTQAAGAVSVEQSSMMSVIPVTRHAFPATGPWPDMRQLSFVVVPQASIRGYQSVLGKSLLSGSVSPQGVVVDAAAVSHWHLGIGDVVALFNVGQNGSPTCQAKITGVVRSMQYGDAKSNSGSNGMIVVGGNVCPDAVAAQLLQSGSIWQTYNVPSSGSPSHWADAVASIGRSPISNPAIWAILAIGLVLWALALLRLTSRACLDGGPTAMTLLREGMRPSQLRRRLRLVLVGCVVLGATISSFLGAWLVSLLTTYYVQFVIRLVVFGGFALVGLVLVLVRTRRWPDGAERRRIGTNRR